MGVICLLKRGFGCRDHHFEMAACNLKIGKIKFMSLSYLNSIYFMLIYSNGDLPNLFSKMFQNKYLFGAVSYASCT